VAERRKRAKKSSKRAEKAERPSKRKAAAADKPERKSKRAKGKARKPAELPAAAPIEEVEELPELEPMDDLPPLDDDDDLPELDPLEEDDAEEDDDLDDLPDLDALASDAGDEDELEELEPLDELPTPEATIGPGGFDIDDDTANAALESAMDLVPDPGDVDVLATLPVDIDLTPPPAAPVIEEAELEELEELETLEELPAGEQDTLLEVGGGGVASAPAPVAAEPEPDPAGPPEKQLPSDSPEELAVMPSEPAATDDRMVRAHGSQAAVRRRMEVVEEQVGSGLLESTDPVEMPAGCEDLIARGQRLRGPHAEGKERAEQAQQAAQDATEALEQARSRATALTTTRDAAMAQAAGAAEALADQLLAKHTVQIAALAGRKLPAGLDAAVNEVARLVEVEKELEALSEGKGQTGKRKKGSDPKAELRAEKKGCEERARQAFVGLGSSSFPLVDGLAKGSPALTALRNALADASKQAGAAAQELQGIDLAGLQGAAAEAQREWKRVEAAEQANDQAWDELAPRVGRLWLAHRLEQNAAPASEEERIWRELHARVQQLDQYVDALTLHLKAAQAEAAAQQTERLESAVTAAREALESLAAAKTGAEQEAAQIREAAIAAARTELEAFDTHVAQRKDELEAAQKGAADAAVKARNDGEAELQRIQAAFEQSRQDADADHRGRIEQAEKRAADAVAKIDELRAGIDAKVSGLEEVAAKLETFDKRVSQLNDRLEGLAARVPATEELDQRTRDASAKVDELATKVEWASNEAQSAAQRITETGAKVDDLVGAVEAPIAEAKAAVQGKVDAFETALETSREALATSEQKTRQKRAKATEELIESVKERALKAVKEFEGFLKKQAGGAKAAAAAPPADADDDEVQLEPIDDEPPARDRRSKREGKRDSKREPASGRRRRR
jgi:hypothetical protein